MNDRLYLKPTREGDVIRDPGHPNKRWSLPAEGARVPDNTFYRRRLISGDVVHVEPDKRTVSALRAAVQQKASDQL